MLRVVVPLLLVAALAAVAAGAAWADGDPASDVLYLQDVFITYSKPSPDVAAALTAEVAKANAAGYRIKVAVIATVTDLGSVPSLFNQPGIYARFLGTELGAFYTKKLLVVMPSGFGVYDNGLPTAADEAVLAGVTIAGPDQDSLTRAATEAVQKLAAAAEPALGKDRVPPKLKLFPATGLRGQMAKLRYDVSDGSGKSRETVRVYGKNLALYATIVGPLKAARPGTVRQIAWKVPRSLKETSLKFCVLARDPAGNESRTVCAPLRIR
jgi:hypothetical protein